MERASGQEGSGPALPSGSCGVSSNLKSLTSVSYLQKNEAGREKDNSAGKSRRQQEKGNTKHEMDRLHKKSHGS